MMILSSIDIENQSLVEMNSMNYPVYEIGGIMSLYLVLYQTIYCKNMYHCHIKLIKLNT